MTRYDPNRHHRRSIRLEGYDYASAGAYFVTLVTQGRECLFGEVKDGEMEENHYGRIVSETWQWLASQYSYVVVDAFTVMPNHLHGILIILDDGLGRGGSRTAPTSVGMFAYNGSEHLNSDKPLRPKPLGRLIGAFKTVSAKVINKTRDVPGAPVWQRNYYEHIIRDQASPDRISQYISDNPARWAEDPENPVP